MTKQTEKKTKAKAQETHGHWDTHTHTENPLETKSENVHISKRSVREKMPQQRTARKKNNIVFILCRPSIVGHMDTGPALKCCLSTQWEPVRKN